MPPTECHDREPRGRKRHQRSHSTRLRSEERAGAGNEPHRSLGPSTPKRGFLRATSRRRQSRPPVEGILQSAKRMSRDFLTSPWKPSRDGKNDSERYRYESRDRSGLSRPQETQVSRPTTPSPGPRANSRKHSGHGRRASHATYPRKLGHSHRPQARDHSAQLVSPTRTRSTQNTTGDRPHSRSNLSDLDGNLEISRMNGLLDIWDSTENPNWEKETFALCDLEYCRRCGKYYMPMRTLRHKCRK
jgi:hypothetical protein